MRTLLAATAVLLLFNCTGPTEKSRTDAPECVAILRSANAQYIFFIQNYFNGPPSPLKMAKWEELKTKLAGLQSQAETKCTCDEPACVLARQAMRELGVIVAKLDIPYRTGGPPPSDLMELQGRFNKEFAAATR